jgi:hypothetical protein
MSVRGLRSYLIYFMRNVAMEQSIPTVKIMYSMHEFECVREREVGYIEVFFQIIICFFYFYLVRTLTCISSFRF